MRKHEQQRQINNPKSNRSCFFYHRPSSRPGGGPGGPGKGAEGGAPANAGGNAGGPLNPSGPGGPPMAPGVPGPGLGLNPADWPPGAGIGGKPGAPGGNGKFGGKLPGGGGGRPWPPGGGGMPGRGGRFPGPGAPGNGGGKGKPRPPGAVRVISILAGSRENRGAYEEACPAHRELLAHLAEAFQTGEVVAFDLDDLTRKPLHQYCNAFYTFKSWGVPSEPN